MGLREQAIAIYQEERAAYEARQAREEAEQRAKLNAQAREAFAIVFDAEPESVEDGICRLDGLTLRYGGTHRQAHFFRLQGVCPRCGKPAWSDEIRCIEDLGRYLVEFAVGYDEFDELHNWAECRAAQAEPAPEPSWAERLQALLDERYGA